MNIKACLFLAIFIFSILALTEHQASAQSVYALSSLSENPEFGLVEGYSYIELDYNTWLYYDGYIDGYLLENDVPIDSGFGQTDINTMYAEVNTDSVVNGSSDYRVVTDHFLFPFFNPEVGLYDDPYGFYHRYLGFWGEEYTFVGDPAGANMIFESFIYLGSTGTSMLQHPITISGLSAILKGNSRQVNVTVNSSAQLTLRAKIGTSGEARFMDDSITKVVGAGTTTLGIKGITESSEVDNLFIEAMIGGITRREYFTVVVLKLKEVEYVGSLPMLSDTLDLYDAPHWQDNSTPLNGTADDSGDRKLPVAYIKGSIMVISAKWVPVPAAPLDGLTVKVRGTVIPETDATVSADNVRISTVPTSVPLSGTVDYIPAYTIDWEASSDLSWIPSGTSRNKVYLTLAAPLAGVILQQTLLDIGCQNAAGLVDESLILNAVWAEFSDRNVIRKRYDLQQDVVSEKSMTYYDKFDATILNAITLLNFEEPDGQCGSWADLLYRTLRALGVSLPIDYVTADINPMPSSIDPLPLLPPGEQDIGFFVKNWSFDFQTTVPPMSEFPQWNLSRGDMDLLLEKSYNWIDPPDVSDVVGIPGQGPTTNPASMFNNHQFLRINGKYYDASYGVIYLSNEDFVANLDTLYSAYVEPTAEQTVGRDLNGDGEIADVDVLTRKHYLKRNPAISIFRFMIVPQP